MGVRTKQLGQGVFANANTTLCTAAAGETVIVKFVTLYNPSTTTATVVRLRAVIGASQRIVWRESLAAQEARQIDLWLVLQPGDSLDAFSVLAANNVEYTVSGTELEGVAD